LVGKKERKEKKEKKEKKKEKRNKTEKETKQKKSSIFDKEDRIHHFIILSIGLRSQIFEIFINNIERRRTVFDFPDSFGATLRGIGVGWADPLLDTIPWVTIVMDQYSFKSLICPNPFAQFLFFFIIFFS